LDDSLSLLTSMLSESGLSEDIKKYVLDIGRMLRDRIVYSLKSIPLRSKKLKDACLHLAGRGKFLRGIFTYLFSKGLGLKEEDAIILALSTELYHLASLIHDDIIDKAPYRRGLQSVHVKFGLETAIVAGDLLIIYSNNLLANLGCDVIKIYSEAGIKLADGEALELEDEMSTSIKDYYKIIGLKTSSVFEAMFVSAVAIAGRNEYSDDAQLLGRYLGYAFQMSDDLLDFLGDPDRMGKLAGIDRDNANIIHILLKMGYAESDAISKVRELIRKNILMSIRYLESIEMNSKYKEFLKKMIYVLEGRNL